MTTDNQPEMKILNFELNVNDTNIVINALRELPHRISDDVLRKIIMQAQSQTQSQTVNQMPEGFQSPPTNFYSKQ